MAAATALYDSSFPRPFTLLNNVPIARINIGKIFKVLQNSD